MRGPPTFYDPMLAKLIVHAPDRDAAAHALAARSPRRASPASRPTSTTCARSRRRALRRRRALDALPRDFAYSSRTVEVLAAGTQTTVQDWPGRIGYWAVGVPPSGPMDDRVLRLPTACWATPRRGGAGDHAERADAALQRAAVIAMTGAAIRQLDGAPQPLNTNPARSCAPAALKLGSIAGAGARSYLACAAASTCRITSAAAATFTLGQFGGHGGRALRAGDVLHLAPARRRAGRRAQLPARWPRARDGAGRCA
jgi:urea carboxylase